MKPTAYFVISYWLLLLLCRAEDGPRPARPQLQIINGSRQPIDIYWLQSDTERVPNGSVAPGQSTVITTTRAGCACPGENRGGSNRTTQTRRVSERITRVRVVPRWRVGLV